MLWFGPDPDEETRRAFQSRHLTVLSAGPATFTGMLAEARAAVFRYNPDKPKQVKDQFAQVATVAANHGLALCYQSDKAYGVDYFTFQIKPSLSPYLSKVVSVRGPNTAAEIPEHIARHEPGPPNNPDLEIGGEFSKALDQDDELLLRRAFHDCSSIVVRALSGGRSDANVVRAYATFNDPSASRPSPFFVKMDSIEEILKEFNSYHYFANHFIPFNLRPNLVPSRCLGGARRGILVGSLVERAESLWSVIQRGSASAAIHSLFENTLRGWRHPVQASGQVHNGSIAADLSSIFSPERIPKDRVKSAKTRGAQSDPEQLCSMLLNLPEQRYLRGSTHGDLHANNVLVRGSDAILIDFMHADMRPLVADPAALEVFVVFELPESSAKGKKKDDREWASVIDRLYAREHLNRIPPPAIEPSAGDWFWNTVRQIRLSTITGNESLCAYFIALCCFMLRWARYDAENAHDEFRRTHAYVVADRLARELERTMSTTE